MSENLAREPLRPVRLLYVEILRNVASEDAVKALIVLSIEHPDEEVRVAALEHLLNLNPPGLADPYIRWLKDRDPRRINRAAIALGQLGDCTAIAPLIEALVTIHEQAVRAGGSSDAISTSFSHDSAGNGGSSFTTGGRTGVVRHAVQNQEVLAALTRLARGPGFGFNQQAWRNWYAIEKSHLEAVEARRDPGQ